MKKVYIGTAEDFAMKDTEELESHDDDTTRALFFELRKKGYAVLAFSPEQLKKADRTHVEERLKDYGQGIIDIENYLLEHSQKYLKK